MSLFNLFANKSEDEVKIENENPQTQSASPAVPPRRTIQEGDPVLLWFEKKNVTYLVKVKKGQKQNIHCGSPLPMDDWIGVEFGSAVKCDHGVGYLLKPTVDDLMMKASRESGIVYPKDAGYLILRCGIAPGSKVLEIGTGSGSLTMALATAVGPTGHVHTFDRREDLPKNADKNLKRAGLRDRVTFHQRVAGDAIPEGDFDAAVLDIPEPWNEVQVVYEALKGSSRIVCLNPTYNQIEKVAEALRAGGFFQVDACELLERPLLAREGRTRPVQRMVSHTEFMTFAIKGYRKDFSEEASSEE